jgi:hypothetical protein
VASSSPNMELMWLPYVCLHLRWIIFSKSLYFFHWGELLYSLWNDFKSGCLDIMNRYIPTKLTSTRYSQPWINREIKQITRRKNKLFKKHQNNKSSPQWNPRTLSTKVDKQSLKQMETVLAYFIYCNSSPHSCG